MKHNKKTLSTHTQSHTHIHIQYICDVAKTYVQTINENKYHFNTT